MPRPLPPKLKLWGAILACVLIAVAAAWRWTPLHEYADAEAIARMLAELRRSPWAPLALLAIYCGANGILFPNTVLNVATILTFGTERGLPYALAGSMVAALVYYFIGRRYGREKLRYLGGRNVDKLSERLRSSGTLGIAGVRLLPIAPFTVVNVLAGALRVRAPAFAAGTFLGLLPGSLLVTAFGHQLREVLKKPETMELALLVTILLCAGAGLWFLKRRAAG